MSIREYLDGFDRRDWQTRAEGTVRFAMIALGWWTREKAIPAVQEADFAETTVVVSGSAEKAASVTAEWETIEAGLTYDEFHEGAAADAYDAIYVCTPNAYHKPYVETAADLEKAVLCEKPMEADVERARSMIEAAENIPFMVAYRLQTEPAVRRAKELIEDGAIGDPALVQGAMSQPLLELIPDPNQWRLDPDVAGYGTSVMDIGLYPLNTTRFLLDSDPQRVSAMGYTDADAFDGLPDERAAFTVQFPEGTLGSFTASQNAAQDSHLRITGTEGQIVLEPAFFPWTDRGFQLIVGGETVDLQWEQVNQMTEEFDYFAHCVLENEEPHSNGQHGLVDMRTLEAIYESIETGQSVSP